MPSLAALPLPATAASSVTSGLKVVFVARQRDSRGVPSGLQHLYVADGDGQNLTQISPLGSSYFYDWPMWAMNGTKILFTARPTLEDIGLEGIYMSNPDGSDVSSILASEWSTGQPKLAPDEQSVLFSASWPQFPGAALYQLTLGTGLVQNLTAQTPRTLHDADGRWSPDGKTVFFAG
jgi:Tol biopolymer transport system component